MAFNCSITLLLRLMQPMGTLVYEVENLRGLLVEMRRCSFRLEAAVRTDFHAFSGGVTVQEAFESIYNAFHGSQYSLALDVIVECACRYLSSDDVRAYCVEGDLFFGQVLSIAPYEADYAAATECQYTGHYNVSKASYCLAAV